MSNETIGSLLELLKIACKKAWENIGFLLIVGAANGFLLIFSGEKQLFLKPDLEVPNSRSLLLMIIAHLIYLGSAYFTVTTIALGRDNSIDSQLRMFGNFFVTRGIKLFCALIVKTLMLCIGLILLVIPGIYISLRAYTMEFAAVFEDKWPIGAFEKSTEITEGNKWIIFGYFLIVSLIAIVLGALVSGVDMFFMFKSETNLMSQFAFLILICLKFAFSVVLLLQACLLYLKRR